jgi:hypothetical protein
VAYRRRCKIRSRQTSFPIRHCGSCSSRTFTSRLSTHW